MFKKDANVKHLYTGVYFNSLMTWFYCKKYFKLSFNFFKQKVQF